MKEKVTINVQITIRYLFRFYMRFKESRRPNGIMNDHLACELTASTMTFLTKLHLWRIEGCVVAVTSIGKCRIHLREPSPIVVNIGWTRYRFQRIMNGAMPHSTNSICRK